MAKHPTFVITERLPCEKYFDKLLGVVVADITCPHHEYCPDAPTRGISSDPDDTIEADVETFLLSQSNASIRADLRALFGLGAESASSTKRGINSKWVLTRRLPQHRKAFEAIVDTYGNELMKMLKNNNGRGYMVVGFKTCIDAEISQGSERLWKLDGNMTIPVSKLATAASHGAAVFDGSMDPSVSVSKKSGIRVIAQSIARGEQIFAVQYRKVSLKKSYFSTEQKAEIRRLKTVDHEDGIYGTNEDDEVRYEDEDSGDEDDPGPPLEKGDFTLDGEYVLPTKSTLNQGLEFIG
ncbi:hypothetical protein AbraIFM66951_004874 [Aspergillus brasiliensis]|uniref:Uncharacterized protein n=1 Tax=Aspergillus brasiliensis TaxID=319629 RepID=A0A9W5Z0Y6_9EURO|nr:hypothetical protein AbraCBS73388_004060 [Aspergillus brasiliensis]GKZ51061.1 hypothetical protein AbraIFM66951_004874 [Aspergillus brasiliensis]